LPAPAISCYELERLGLRGHAYDYLHALSGGMRQRVLATMEVREAEAEEKAA